MPDAVPVVPETWPAAIRALHDQVAAALRAWRERPDSADPRLLRIVQPCPPTPASHWLAAQSSPVQVFWRGKEDRFARAGIGFADRVPGATSTDYRTVLNRCRRLPLGEARYYGGFAFDEGAADDPGWLEFGPAQFWLPRVEFVEGDTRSTLCVNLLLLGDPEPDEESLLAEILAVHPPVAAPPAIPILRDRRDFPGFDRWEAAVNAALELIRDGALEKIVLARKAVHGFDSPVVPSAMMARLESVTSHCYHFCLQPSATSAFLGTTPERLFRRDGRGLRTEVIAGTRPRGDSPEEDARFGDDLLGSAKDQLEHDIVRKFLRQRLHLLGDESRVAPEAVLLKLERKQHLHSPAQAHLRPRVGDAEILTALHPTPAVGGAPSENARAEIPRLEPFRRGWYAGPVGWIGEDAAEFAVAIRSGLVRGPTVSVYSGAGIVTGSVPAEEWAEIENKIADFRKVVGQPSSAASLRSASAQ